MVGPRRVVGQGPEERGRGLAACLGRVGLVERDVTECVGGVGAGLVLDQVGAGGGDGARGGQELGEVAGGEGSGELEGGEIQVVGELGDGEGGVGEEVEQRCIALLCDFVADLRRRAFMCVRLLG